MVNIKNYKLFTESEITNMDERDIIVNILCPLFIKKYNELMKWGKTKTYTDGTKLNKLIFEKKNEDSDWNIIMAAPGWSSNDTNRITDYVLSKEYKKIAKDNGINIQHVNYASAHNPNGTEIVIYDVDKGIEIQI
jgi:hypothetical protein